VPVVATAHSCVATWWAAVRGGDLPPHWAWQRARTLAGLRRADLVLAPSRSHAAAIERCYGPLEAVRVVSNAVASSAAGPDKLPYVVAAARWWDEGKNARLLDEAAGRASWPVLAAGATEGPDGTAFTFHHALSHGPVPAPEMRHLIGRAAIVASPSLYEPFGLVALEGAAAGAALVLSDIPTYRELWEGAALFAPADDAAAFAAAIDTLAVDPARRLSLGREAAARAAALSPERQAEALLAAYAAMAAPQLAAAE
jgi:glycosyltransferase involved in cell wall biosynthesis